MIDDAGWNKYNTTLHAKVPTDGPNGGGTHCTHYPEYNNDKVQISTCRSIVSKTTCESAQHNECAWVEAKADKVNKRCITGITLTSSPSNLAKCNERCVKMKDCTEFYFDSYYC